MKNSIVIGRLAALALKAVVLGIAAWYFWPKLDLRQFEAALYQTSLAAALVVLLLFLAQAALAALRWHWIVRAAGYAITRTNVLDAWLVGQCASQVLPALIGGDAARILRLRSHGVSLPVTTVTVIVDRFCGFAVLLVLSLLSVTILASREPGHKIPSEIWQLVAVFAVVFGMMAWCLWLVPRLRVTRLLPSLSYARSALMRIPTDSTSLLVLGFTGLGTNLTLVVAAFILGHAINPGIDFFMCLALLPLVTLLGFLPFSIAGWGLREALMVEVFGLVGIPPADALAVSVQLGIGNLVLGLIGGIFWVFYPTKADALQTKSSREIALETSSQGKGT